MALPPLQNLGFTKLRQQLRDEQQRNRSKQSGRADHRKKIQIANVVSKVVTSDNRADVLAEIIGKDQAHADQHILVVDQLFYDLTDGDLLFLDHLALRIGQGKLLDHEETQASQNDGRDTDRQRQGRPPRLVDAQAFDNQGHGNGKNGAAVGYNNAADCQGRRFIFFAGDDDVRDVAVGRLFATGVFGVHPGSEQTPLPQASATNDRHR